MCVYIYNIYINIYKNLATVSPIFSHFQVHNKLEAKVGACGWRKTFRKRHIDRSKKGCQQWSKRIQTAWLVTLGGMGVTNRRESSVLFLTTTCTSTVISVKSSVKKKAWPTKALWYGAELKQGDVTLVSEGTLCNGCSLLMILSHRPKKINHNVDSPCSA